MVPGERECKDTSDGLDERLCGKPIYGDGLPITNCAQTLPGDYQRMMLMTAFEIEMHCFVIYHIRVLKLASSDQETFL